MTEGGLLDKSTSFLAPWRASLLKTHHNRLPSLPCLPSLLYWHILGSLPTKLLACKSLTHCVFAQK